jgi:hypothetical protein
MEVGCPAARRAKQGSWSKWLELGSSVIHIRQKAYSEAAPKLLYPDFFAPFTGHSQATADGGFASKENLAFAKEHHIKDAVFAKKRGLSVLDMAKSNWVYKKLRNFRAGIEAGISTLKRAFGLDRCTWSGWEGFKRYVWSSIVSYNLLALARIRLASA